MSYADDLVARFKPWLTPDLETYLRAIASMMSQVELYAMDWVDDDGVLHEGWERLFDPDLCPYEALPYLAQLVGEQLPPGIEEAPAREWIKDNPNAIRGTNLAVFLAAQRRLTGSRLVSVRERDGAGGAEDVDRLTVVTYTNQTPDPTGTEHDIREVADINLEINYVVATGQSWADVRDTYASWQALKDSGLSWADVAAGQAGYSTYQRPVVG